MNGIVSLEEARDTALFGSKAVGLGDALRSGLRVPPGIALAGEVVEAVARGDESVVAAVRAAAGELRAPLAVRSSAADEDGAEASFAGQHLTLLNVPSIDELVPALQEIWWSANTDSAVSYRQRVGLLTRPSIGVVVQSLLDPEVAGVLFTTNPVTQADERVIEASWGLGEAVVAALVIPDHFRVARDGAVLERSAGRKQIAIRSTPAGGTSEESLGPELAAKLCLDDSRLAELGELATNCEHLYGLGRDIEWAVDGGDLYVLQCRAITTAGPARRRLSDPDAAGAARALKPVPLFADLNDEEREEVARLFKSRRFAAGETVIKEGTAGAAFFLIEAGEATVTIGGATRTALGPGDFFGEIALIDEGPRSATVTAASDLECRGITRWDFRPLVERDGVLGWKLLQAMVRRLREVESTERPD